MTRVADAGHVLRLSILQAFLKGAPGGDQRKCDARHRAGGASPVTTNGVASGKAPTKSAGVNSAAECCPVSPRAGRNPKNAEAETGGRGARGCGMKQSGAESGKGRFIAFFRGFLLAFGGRVRL